MAIVSDIPITDEQYDQLADLTTEQMSLRISAWPDGSITVDDGDTIFIELTTRLPLR